MCGPRWAAAQARQLCPHAAVVSPRMSAYSEASKAVFEVFEEMSPMVEALSIDEAFLDVRGLERIIGTPIQIAVRAAAGGARAGGAADHGRRRAHEVPGQGRQRRGQARRAAAGAAGLRARVPASAPGRAALGRRQGDSRKLREQGITTVGQVAALSETTLVSLLGRASGRQLHALAHNRDPRPVVRRRRRRSIGAQRALGRRRRTARGADDGADGAGRARHPAAADGRAAVPDDRAADALRGLRARDPLAHAARADGAHAARS